MRNNFTPSTLIAPFEPPQSLLVADRPLMPPVMSMMGGHGQDQDLVDSLLNELKPKKDDYKALTKGLGFLKFSADDVESIVSMVGSVATLASGIGSVMGAYHTAEKFLTTLGVIKSTGFNLETAVKQIGQTVKQIYGYLELTEKKGLYEEAMQWRSAVTLAEAAIETAAISASPAALHDLEEHANALNAAILAMLSMEKSSIAFRRSAYSDQTWITISGSNFLLRADGAPTQSLSNPATDMTTLFWDPGHYIDILAASLRLRLTLAVASEPLYRSTGYRRADIASLIPPLRQFIDQWRASLMVANPNASMFGDGTLVNPPGMGAYAGNGILIGAVDPVTGVSSLRLFDAFPITYERTSLPWAAWGGVWDSSRAVDPQKAMWLATQAHAAAVEQIVQACGLREFSSLLQRLSSAASPPFYSDAVRLTDAKYVSPHVSPVQDVQQFMPTQAVVDLGPLKQFASDPGKTYNAMRYYSTAEKVFTFTMARRARQSGVRLGCDLHIGSAVFELTTWDTQPAPEEEIDYFPSQAFEKPLEIETEVFDCLQSRQMSAKEEDAFEVNGKPGKASRVFFNARKGKGHLKLRIEYQALADGANNAHVGTVTVRLQPMDPIEFPDAFALGVRITETHLNGNARPQPEETFADSMSVHIVPSFLVVPEEFFKDLEDAQVRMAQATAGMRNQFDLSALLQDLPMKPRPDPQFASTWFTKAIQTDAVVLASAMAKRNMAAELQRYLIAPLRRG